MAVPNLAIALLLLATIGMTFFSAITARRCYSVYMGQIDEFECRSERDGCGTAQCGDEEVRGCVNDDNDKFVLYVNSSMDDIFAEDNSCKKSSFCNGNDNCNYIGLRKTGRKCNRKSLFGNENEITVQECTTNHIGCDVMWYSTNGKRYYALGCTYTNLGCNLNDNANGRSCCDTDLCNNKSLLPKIGEKSTTPKNEEKTTMPESNEKSTPKDEESTPENEENPDPPNGAAAGIAQIVIVPIGMMALVIGARLFTMLNI